MPAIWMQILPILALLLLGFCIGSTVEWIHFWRLARREDHLRYMLLTDVRSLPAGCASEPCGLVVGEAVIAADIFKAFLASMRKMVGGDLRAYETLLERARREAIVRMQESARGMGANRVVNVRLASSDIGGMQRRRRAAMVEVYAYGTAVCVPEAP